MQLVIAEKPSVGNSLASVLGAKNRNEGFIEGNGYIVSWCVGHLIGLADAAVYNEKYGKWRLEDLPILPEKWEYVVFDKQKRKQFNILKRLMERKDVDRIICATDAGREGELIFRFVYHMTNCKKPFSRLWISSMEESAIRKGFAEMKDGKEYDALYDSALCRAQADWLVGINATRTLSTLYNKTLNVGRVQTPTLAMLIERQQKINSFIKERYHTVKLELDGIELQSGHIKEPEKALQIQTACRMSDESGHYRQAVCVSAKKEKKSTAPPKLFDLTALQRECNRIFGYTAQQTLDAAQRLYENKLITYPRTDSRFITSDMAAGIPLIAQSSIKFIGIGEDISIPVRTGQLVNNAKVTDHHAIIPTAEINKPDPNKLTEADKNVLSVVTVRFLCALGDTHIYDAIEATFECNGHKFTAKGKTVTAAGWKEVESFFKDSVKSKTGDTDTEDEDSHFPEFAEGQIFDIKDVTIAENYTQPPKSYTEDTLLLAMEKAGAKETNKEAERSRSKPCEHGLGTPATRASIIEKLVSGGFIKRKGKLLIPSEDGENLIKVMPDILKSPQLTADWENALTRVAKGELPAKEFMQGIEIMIKKIVADNTEPVEEFKALFFK